MSNHPQRVVALGASNLTRGLHSVVSAARTTWGAEVELLAALGHGRSYGAPSRLAWRALPGILQSGLWRQLETVPARVTRALVTDVGNDVLYGFDVERILDWVEQVLERLERTTHDVVVTGLPLHSVRRLSKAKFLLFRTLLVPACRLSLTEVLERAERVDAGLARLAAGRGLRFCTLRPEWYGFDPIHMRPRCWQTAWQELLGAHGPTPGLAERWEALRLYARFPERQWLAGLECVTPQHGQALPAGARLWLY
jgi:hypothetical protein